MYAVEIALSEKDRLGETIEAMRTWLDHQRFEPATFRYSFASARVLFSPRLRDRFRSRRLC